MIKSNIQKLDNIALKNALFMKAIQLSKKNSLIESALEKELQPEIYNKIKVVSYNHKILKIHVLSAPTQMYFNFLKSSLVSKLRETLDPHLINIESKVSPLLFEKKQIHQVNNYKKLNKNSNGLESIQYLLSNDNLSPKMKKSLQKISKQLVKL